MRAVITAGGIVDEAYARIAGARIKALAAVRGRTMLDRAIDAAAACGAREIAVVGAPDVEAVCDGRVRTIRAAESGAQNVLLALRAWPDDEPLLYLTSDMPYLTPASLRDFVERAAPGTLAMPLTDHDAFVRRFPAAPPFGITLAGERVVNGGAFVLPAGARAAIERLATTMFDARKAPWRMATLVGPAFLVRFAMRRLSVHDVEMRAQRVLGFRAAAVRDAAPELAYDADTAEEFAYALERD